MPADKNLTPDKSIHLETKPKEKKNKDAEIFDQNYQSKQADEGLISTNDDLPYRL
jgi:hypothetical protein